MQHKTLTNKWRPKKLNDIIGQDQSIFIIKNIISTKKIHNSYIINGPQGTGKTSLARIIAKCLNCEVSLTTNPCDKCYCCQSITKGNNIDLIEIDAASKTKIEDIKEITDLSKYKNSNNRYKIFIIDECHMLSISSFNYLLKILEEPTNYTIYILITTQIEKIPQTIISRCIDIQLNKISKKNIKKRLTYIINSEKITCDNYSLEYVSNFSNGSMRQAINTIEKLIQFKDNAININNIIYILGLIPEISILFIIKNIYECDIKNILKMIKNLTQKNLNYKNILIQIQIMLNKIILYKTNIIYDQIIIKYKIFLYLSKKLKYKDINNIYLNILTFLNSDITETDFEIILINLATLTKES